MSRIEQLFINTFITNNGISVYINFPTHRKGVKNSSGISGRFRGGNATATGSVTVTSLLSSSSSLVENTRGTETKRAKIYFCIFWITLPEAAPSAAFRHLIGAFNFPFIRMQPSQPRASQRLTCKSDVSSLYEPACPLIIEFVEKRSPFVTINFSLHAPFDQTTNFLISNFSHLYIISYIYIHNHT